MHLEEIPEFEPRPPFATYEDVAGRIEHTLIRPNLTEEDLHAGLAAARQYRVGTVVVRPCDVDLAVRTMEGSGVVVASVCGFPHGSTTTAAKLYEGRDLLRRGAKQISIVANFGKVFARQFQFIESEILQMRQSCHENGATSNVIFETGYLTEDLKIILCKICKRCEVDFADTSTGFGPRGYSMEDITLLRRIAKGKVGIKVSGSLATLSQLTEAYLAGADRFGTAQTSQILDEWKVILAERAKQAAAEAGAQSGAVTT